MITKEAQEQGTKAETKYGIPLLESLYDEVVQIPLDWTSETKEWTNDFNCAKPKLSHLPSGKIEVKWWRIREDDNGNPIDGFIPYGGLCIRLTKNHFENEWPVAQLFIAGSPTYEYYWYLVDLRKVNDISMWEAVRPELREDGSVRYNVFQKFLYEPGPILAQAPEDKTPYYNGRL